jgi:hypothetical protein
MKTLLLLLMFFPHASSPAVILPDGYWVEEPQDPAYGLFREGYQCILDERWGDARKRFAEVLAKYPRSRFAADATYWTAFSLKQTDTRKALEAYAQFLQRYPDSGYFEDALVDFSNLRSQMPRRADSLRVRVRIAPPPRMMMFPGPDMQSMELAMERIQKMLRRTALTSRRMAHTAQMIQETLADPALRKRLDSLVQLSENTNDEEAFHVLAETAVDDRQPPAFRRVALQELTGFHNQDPLPVLRQAAQEDPVPENRYAAVSAIGTMRHTPGPAIEALGALFSLTRDGDMRIVILDAAAGIGTPQALTFLVRVAREEEDSEAQTAAIEYLSFAGENKDRSVENLVQVFRALPADRRAAREAALYGVAEVGNDRAVEFLADIARSRQDPELRRNAVFFLGNIGGDKARRALREILREP